MLRIVHLLNRAFQFLGRNSGRSDVDLMSNPGPVSKFQFLGRNSGRSDRKSVL